MKYHNISARRGNKHRSSSVLGFRQPATLFPPSGWRCGSRTCGTHVFLLSFHLLSKHPPSSFLPRLFGRSARVYLWCVELFYTTRKHRRREVVLTTCDVCGRRNRPPPLKTSRTIRAPSQHPARRAPISATSATTPPAVSSD